jgi:hypothetical protein
MPNSSDTIRDAARIEAHREGNAFDTGEGYSGQDYDLARERAEGRKLPSGTVDRKARGVTAEQEQGEIPADNGHRASFDPATGEVRGSGAADGLGDGRGEFSKDT